MNNKYTYKGYEVEIVFSGAPGWFDFYVNGIPMGCSRPEALQARVKQAIDWRAGQYNTSTGKWE
jgi:hypothetical protein